jgi:predicted RecA/RadA family phage recombinase
MKTFVQPGSTLTLTASRAVTAGQGMLRGATFGVAVNDVANGATGEFDVTGVFTLPKVGAQAQAEGVLVYWDNTNFNVTTTVGSNTKIGVVATTGGELAAATTVAVRLNGAF